MADREQTGLAATVKAASLPATVAAIVSFVVVQFGLSIPNLISWKRLSVDQNKQIFDIVKWHAEIKDDPESPFVPRLTMLMGDADILPKTIAYDLACIFVQRSSGAPAGLEAIAAKLTTSGHACDPPRRATRTTTSTDPEPGKTSIRATFYAQYGPGLQRADVDAKLGPLRRIAGLSVATPEFVGSYRGGNEIRFFRNPDREAATALFDQLRGSIGGLSCKLVRGYEDLKSPTVELWLSNLPANPTPATGGCP